MKTHLFTSLAVLALVGPLASARAEAPTPVAGAVQLRPPAVPLVAHDPYFSIWSPADKLTDADTFHWTGKPHRLTSVLHIDGKPYCVLGKRPKVPALPQIDLTVLPTRTIYVFEGSGIRLRLTFMSPALPEDVDLISWPVTYVIWEVQATDERQHWVFGDFVANPEIAVNDSAQPVMIIAKKTVNDLEVVGVGSVEQPTLQKKGDDLRIDWGHLYLASRVEYIPDRRPLTGKTNLARASTVTFAKMQQVEDTSLGLPPGELPVTGSSETSEPANSTPSLVKSFSFGWVDSKPISSLLMLAYDDEFSIQYMKQNLRPYWRRNGDDAAALLKKAAADYESLKKRCEQFDAELMADLRQAGGEKYARLGALAYRQCFAAGKFVADANGQPLQFCKENHSNGCIGTSDVFYPMAPQFLLFGPTLAKSFLVPFMNYAASERWKFSFAPHDLGTYPHANGQVYGGGERNEQNQMPVEESGNLLILFAAIGQMEGNADFAKLYWKQLQTWAEYLKAKGFDPENQLCTDDFAGHLAHNVNLSAKAIVALGAFGKLCELRGRPLTPSLSPSDGERVAKPGEGAEWIMKGAEYSQLAKELARRWVKEADDGDHFRLAFDRPGTWSQKYNLVWDRILGLNLFPAEVARKEMDYYRKIQNRYGLPLDNRKDYTKLDWTVWTATLTQNRADFEALIDPLYAFLNETPDRSPMTDWYQTKTAKKVGFTARPVVGAVFLPLLYDQAVWKKWASRDKTKASGWAPMPQPPKRVTVVPAADTAPANWHYTTTQPADNWMKPGFEDSTWQEGKSGFGTKGTPGAIVGTTWNTSDIWLRREVEIPAEKLNNLALWLHHDEDATVFINGVEVLKVSGWTTDYESFPLSKVALAAFKPGRNLLAIHCRQKSGGQYIDGGLISVESVK